MNLDDYGAFRRGKLSLRRALESVITTVASGVYTYMVMLEILDRKQESRFFSDIRDRVFAIRSKLSEQPLAQEELDQLSVEMSMVYRDLNTAYIYLQAHKPEEATILQSVTNTACGLVHSIKHHGDDGAH